VAAGLSAVAGAASISAQSAGERHRIKIGQIGVAHAHAAGKMAAYRGSTDFEVVGVVETDAKLREEAQRSPVYRDLRWMTREELLNVPGLQAVAVETAVRDLLENAEAAVAAGKHIHLDKPAGSSLPRFRKVLAEARRRKLVVQMGYMYRYNPGVVFLREALRKGWLGEPFEVHGVMSKVVDPASRRRFAEYPGGMMFELGCHLIDLVVAVLGRPAAVTPFARHSAPLDDGLLDNQLAVLEYPRAVATVKSSALEVEGFARRHLVVCGSEGTVHIQPLDDPAVRLALARPRDSYPAGYEDVSFPKYERYVADAEDFAKVIRGEKDHDFPVEHDEAVQETVLRASGLPLER
jgi:predicted dehydrogenase